MMTVNEAFQYIDAYFSLYDGSPTTVGKSDAWIKLAGELCKKRIATLGKEPVTDALLEAKLGEKSLPKDYVI